MCWLACVVVCCLLVCLVLIVVRSACLLFVVGLGSFIVCCSSSVNRCVGLLSLFVVCGLMDVVAWWSSLRVACRLSFVVV